MTEPIDWQGRRQHGTRSSYSGGCRCNPCKKAQADANRYYDRRKVQEKWGAVPPLLVDSEPSRRHYLERRSYCQGAVDVLRKVLAAADGQTETLG